MRMRLLARLTRIRAYLLTLFLIVALIFLISPQSLFSFRTAVVFFANLFMTAFVYAFNDVEDAADDYVSLEKRRRNPIANGELSRTQGYLISFLLLLIGFFLLSIISPSVFFFGLILALVGFFYSWKPVRLKSVPFVDLISHVICLGALQFFIAYLAFRPLDLFVIPFLMMILPPSLMVEILFELRDFSVDRKSNITNTIQRFGKLNVKNLLITSGVTTAVGFTIIILTIPSEYRIVILLGSIFAAIVIVSKVNRFLKMYC
ncbi:MAG: UbiA family prenyltransferase [Candidatus Bathyarchaeota archaeon]|nr:MAG: UbiA family prenyltransferase [Candidatus Bathyarchaeota archaeon]